jgi:hypothetical protein
MTKEQNIKDNLQMILNMVMASKHTKLAKNFKVYSNLVPKLMENCTINSKNKYKLWLNEIFERILNYKII